jgi:hypothetical protein
MNDNLIFETKEDELLWRLSECGQEIQRLERELESVRMDRNLAAFVLVMALIGWSWAIS